MKRKQPSSNGGAKPAAPKPAAAPKPTAKASAKAQQKFVQPMRRLEDFSEDDEEQDEESARHDRKHMQQIDQDVDADEDDAEQLSDGQSEVDDEDDEDERAADDAEEDQDAEMDGADAEDQPQQAADADNEEAPILELDLPLQVVQGTYSGVLYGLKTKESLRKIRAYHTKRHSKKGIEEADISNDEEDDEDDMSDDLEDDDENAASSGAPSAAGHAATPAASSLGLLFTNAAHIGSIKALAISSDGKWMVSGGMDETIKIFKTAVMREFGQLHQHSGSVVALEFYGSGFLLSGGQEGDLCLWNTKTWQLLRKFAGAHEGSAGAAGGVSCLSVHPSGRVALSVGGSDRKVKLWDLMKGQLASERKMDFPVTAVRWAVGGERYALMGEKRFDIYDTSSTLLRREEVSETKLLSLVWLSENLLALGCEDKTVRIHSAESGECVATLQGHQVRVRGLDAVTVPLSSSSPSSSSKKATFLASADTNGQTFLWDLTQLVQANPTTSGSLGAIHPCASSFHDQRVTILRILPHYAARKDDASLKQPVQTQAAEERQREVRERKEKNAQAKGHPSQKDLTPAEAKEAKARRLFEKAQRSHAAKHQAAAKAKRLLAKMNPRNEGATEGPDGTLLDGSDAGQPAKKKLKPSFEEAPMVDSDEEPQAGMRRGGAGEDSEDEEDPPAPVVPAKKKQPTPSSQPAQKKQQPQQKSTAPAAAASQQKSQKPSAQPAAASHPPSPSNKKPSKPSSSSSSGASSTSHIGFSAALPLFKPKLHDQRGKKKSDRKIERDAARKQARRQ